MSALKETKPILSYYRDNNNIPEYSIKDIACNIDSLKAMISKRTPSYSVLSTWWMGLLPDVLTTRGDFIPVT